jgi:hypothetical protein
MKASTGCQPRTAEKQKKTTMPKGDTAMLVAVNFAKWVFGALASNADKNSPAFEVEVVGSKSKCLTT